MKSDMSPLPPTRKDANTSASRPLTLTKDSKEILDLASGVRTRPARFSSRAEVAVSNENTLPRDILRTFKALHKRARIALSDILREFNLNSTFDQPILDVTATNPISGLRTILDNLGDISEGSLGSLQRARARSKDVVPSHLLALYDIARATPNGYTQGMVAPPWLESFWLSHKPLAGSSVSGLTTANVSIYGLQRHVTLALIPAAILAFFALLWYWLLMLAAWFCLNWWWIQWLFRLKGHIWDLLVSIWESIKEFLKEKPRDHVTPLPPWNPPPPPKPSSPTGAMDDWRRKLKTLIEEWKKKLEEAEREILKAMLETNMDEEDRRRLEETRRRTRDSIKKHLESLEAQYQGGGP